MHVVVRSPSGDKIEAHSSSSSSSVVAVETKIEQAMVSIACEN